MTRVVAPCLAVMVLAAAATGARQGVMYHFPQWAPGGDRILVTANLDGDMEVYLLSLDGSRPVKLTDNTATDDVAQWIDEGRRIVFFSDRRGRQELFVMGADGGDQQPAAAGDRPRALSPDGRYELLDERGVVFAVERATGTRRALTAGPHASQGRYSPDGRRLVFEQRATADPHRVELSNIVVARADGREPAIVAAGTDPAWSPDGSHLIFKSWDAARRMWVIATARPDGSGMRRLGAGVHPQWSPDGTQILFAREQGRDMHVWVMARDGGAARCLTCAH